MVGPVSPRPRLRELDALRGLGALLVVNFHYSTRFPELFPAAGHVPFHLFGGNYRVLLFFALSGFAIFFTMGKLRSSADFVVGRFARLMPTYWMAILLTLGIEHLGGVRELYIPVGAVIANFTMLEQFFFLPAVDGAYWTLTIEIAFYACMLALWRFVGLKHVERTILCWLAIKLVFGLLWTNMPERLVMLLILRWVPFFAIGMIAYRLWSGKRSLRDQAPIVAAVLLTLALTEDRSYLLAGVILCFVFLALINGYLRWLCVAPLLWVGEISYSLYLIHQHIGFTIMLNADAAGWNPLLAYAAAVFAAFLLGWMLNRYVEKPSTRWILARWERFQLRRSAQRAAREQGAGHAGVDTFRDSL